MNHGNKWLVRAALLCVTAMAAAPGAGLAAESQAAATGSEVDASGPSVLISSAATAMLRDLDAHRAEYRKDPARIEQLVNRVLLPYFDTDYAAQQVLGRHWTGATELQRRRFVDGFYHSLLRNYSSALADFTSDRLKVIPFTGDPNATSATVRTQVRKNDGSLIAVNYTLRRGAQGWKAWDVIIEGIGYVKSFRDDFGAEVDRNGLDALIARLEAQAAGKAEAPRGKDAAKGT